MFSRIARFGPIVAAGCMAAVCTLLVAQPAPCAVPSLVKDINTVPTGTVVKDSFPIEFLSLNSRIYFSATTAATARELYVTDGTGTGTSILKDIAAGSGSSSPAGLTALDATRFVFSAFDSTNGRELWISDGTAAGTQLLKDINVGTGNSSPTNFLNIGGGVIVFWASDGTDAGGHGRELWRTDGTTAGTLRLSDIAPGTASSAPQVPAIAFFAGKVFFSAHDGSPNSELYTTDGTNPASTALFMEINPFPGKGSAPRDFAVLSPTRMLFHANDGTVGDELWSTNGTVGGTSLLKDIHVGTGSSFPAGLTVYSGKVYFAANGGTGIGRELYVSDGTAPGTSLLKDIDAGPHSGNPRYFTPCNGKLFFNATDAINGGELWVTDGTAGGTISMNSVPGTVGLNPWNLCSVTLTGIGQRLMFQGFDSTFVTADRGSKPWISDGTPGGTTVLAEVYQGTTGHFITAFTGLGGAAYFSANDGTGVIGRELWKTDGTSGGTTIVADIAQPSGTANSSPVNLTAVGSTLFFQANDGSTGNELHKSDGTAAGTNLVKDIVPGTGNSNTQNYASNGTLLFFQANNGSTNNGAELWTSDGTEGGTNMLVDINPGTAGSSPSNLTYNGSVILFTANNGTNGIELWSSDGTVGGTAMVTDLNIGAPGSNPGSLFRDGSDVYMAATGPVGTELYRYRAGTLTLVADIHPTGSSFPTAFAKLGNLLLYRATDGTNGSELWATDVTTDVTTMVLDINPGAANSNPQGPAVAGGKLFFVATNGTNGFELFVSDGTPGGTEMLTDVNPGSASGLGALAAITPLGNKVVFRATDGANGNEPWVSDGTLPGTFMLKDIGPPDSFAPFGSGLQSSANFFVANGAIYFAANDGINVHGNELWKTDGTIAGTVLAADINLGSGTGGYSNPGNFCLIGNTLYFAASNGAAQNGIELFKLDVTP